MSDFSSSPTPVGNTPHVKPREGGQQQPSHREHPEEREGQTQQDVRAVKAVDDPAVSVAATIAGVHAGDRLTGPIVDIDVDGHPVYETVKGRFVINPTAGLEKHIQAEILITHTGGQIEGRLVARNGVKVEPPVEVALTLIATRGDAGPDNPAPAPVSTPSYPHLPRTSSIPHSTPLPTFDTNTLAQTLAKGLHTISVEETPLTPELLRSFSTALLNEQVQITPLETTNPLTTSGFTLGEPITAKVLDQGDSPKTPFETVLQATRQNTISVAVIAVTQSHDLSPIASPHSGTPLAILSDHGRVATFVVEETQTEKNSVTAKHADLRLSFPVEGPPPAPGTKITALSLTAQPEPLSLPPIAAPQLAPQNWPVGEAVLEQGAALPATAPVNQRIPSFGPKLTNTALFLWRALNTGSAETWLGTSTKETFVAKGQQDLWTALQRDIALLSDAQRGGGSEWRPWPLPVQSDGNIQLLSWFVRPLPYDEDEGGKAQGDHTPRDGGSEFVVDARFEGYGRLRFHGEIHRTQLNLSIASTRPLPDSLKASTGQLFRTVLDTQGMTGLLRFKLGLEQDGLPGLDFK